MARKRAAKRSALPPPPPPAAASEESVDSDESEEEPARASAPNNPEQSVGTSDEEAPPPNKPPSSSGKAAKNNRVWSVDDEVRILEAAAAHLKEHGALPHPDDLVDHLMGALAGKLDHTAYGAEKLKGKLKNMKHRYLRLAKKGDLPTKEPDSRLFALSKVIWGGVETAAVPAKANGRHEVRGFREMCELFPCLAAEVIGLDARCPGMFKRAFGKMDDDDARELDARIKKQRLAQMKMEMRGHDLTKEVSEKLMELVECSFS